MANILKCRFMLDASDEKHCLFLKMRSSAVLHPCVLVISRQSLVPVLKNTSTEKAGK